MKIRHVWANDQNVCLTIYLWFIWTSFTKYFTFVQFTPSWANRQRITAKLIAVMSCNDIIFINSILSPIQAKQNLTQAPYSLRYINTMRLVVALLLYLYRVIINGVNKRCTNTVQLLLRVNASVDVLYTNAVHFVPNRAVCVQREIYTIMY